MSDASGDDAIRPRRAVPRAWVKLGGFAGLLGAAALVTLVFIPFDQRAIREAIEPFGTWGPLAFAVLAALLALIFVPGPLLSATSGVLFGVWLGFGVTVASSALTAVLALLLARRAGAKSYEELSGPRGLALADLARRHALAAVVIQRLVPGLPDAPFSYLFGVLRLGVGPVLLGTIIGSAPRAFAYTALGTAAATKNGNLAIVAASVVIIVGVVGALLGAALVRFKRRAAGPSTSGAQSASDGEPRA